MSNTLIGGVNLGGLTEYLFFFADGSEDANWQGATKGFVGDVAVDGLLADERTSGGVPFTGKIVTNDVDAGAWEGIISQNAGTATVSTNEIATIASLESDLDGAFSQIDGLTATAGYEAIDASELDGLNTQNGVAETFVINVTSGFDINYAIDITGDADDVFILRWDENADSNDGYQGTVKFSSGGGINPLGDLSASNFIHTAGDINASGGGSTPSGLVDEVNALDGVGGGGFFTGYWLTTGDPVSGDTQSLSNAIFVGGWYTTSDKFSLTSGTSGVYVAPSNNVGTPVDPTDPDCIQVLENTTGPIIDLDCGEEENPDFGLDICVLTNGDNNQFGEKTDKPSAYTLTLGDLSADLVTSATGDALTKVQSKVEVGAIGGTDDGDGVYYVIVTSESDVTKATADGAFFAGAVEQGDSFTASGSFGSETFVHIFASEGGSALQTINYHTSCSSPLIIGDQYGSVTLSGATVEGQTTGTAYQVGVSDAPGDAGVIYEITGGADAAFFEVDAETGVVTFKEAPDFENPQDANGDNQYDVVVTAFFTDEDGAKIPGPDGVCEVKPIEVCVEDDCIQVLENTTGPIIDLDCGEEENPDFGLDICVLTNGDNNQFGEKTDKPSAYTLTLGDLSADLVTSATGDALTKVQSKVEVGAIGGTDDGDGVYYVIVTSESDVTKATADGAFFAGAVEQGDSFTASGSFGSETFVHIFASEGGSALQTINYHTSCSSPLIIGDQYGSVTLSGATVEGQTTGTAYQVGVSDAPGDAGVIYEITGGADAAFFEVDAETGVVTFKEAPDFENPQDANGDNQYDVVVTAFFTDEDGAKIPGPDGVCEVKPIEVCVEDDCINVSENSTGPVFDFDCGKVENPDIGFAVCEVDKPTEYTFRLDTEIDSQLSAFQPDGKSSVVTTGASEDGDGLVFVRMSDSTDATDVSSDIYFQGSLALGESFTTVGDGTFSSNSYIHIFDDDGATLLQTIQFHTSCSAPIVIGDQIGTAILDAAVANGVTYGVINANPDEGLVYEITGGESAALFTVDSETGEVFFINPPDFENPKGIDGTNTYQVEVTAFVLDDNGDKLVGPDGEFVVCGVKPLDICVEDDGCINITANDAQTVDLDLVADCPDDTGLELCAERDRVEDGGADLTKIAKLSLTLTDALVTDVDFFYDDPVLNQGDKAEVITTGGASGSIFVIVSKEGDVKKAIEKFLDPSKGVNGNETYFAGDVDFGDEIVAMASNEFASSTHVYIFDSAPANKDAAAAQAIEFHTSCSEPIVIGDRYGSVTLTGAAFRDKGTGELVEYAAGPGLVDEASGDLIYSIVDGPVDANGDPLFTVDPATGEVTFNAPDYIVDGFNKYEATVRATVAGDPDCFTEEVVCYDVNPPLLGSITGRYFCDEVRDDRDDEGTGDSSFGNVNGTEEAIAGVTVRLIRFNEDGTRDVLTTTTDENGEYFFGDLEAGEYRVRFVEVDGKAFVDPNVGEDTRDSDVNQNGLTPRFTLAAGENVKDVDAGVEKLLGSISGRYFCDDVRDDRDDEGTGPSSFGNINGTETAIAGVLVTLVDGAGATVATTTTDANGEYFFGGLEAGDYRVIFPDQADKDFVDPNVGEDTRDSDVVTGPAGDGSTGVINLAAGQNVKDVDAGAEKLLGSISGRYFCDDVRDDRDDEGTGPSSFGNVNGTETAIAGVLVTLVDGAGATVATATTDANGEYFFGGLEAGAYRVIFLDQADKDFVDPNKGEDTRDSDVVTGPAGDGSTGVINLAAGQNVKDVDAGAEKLLGSISGRYFCDDVRDDRDDEGTGPSSFGNVNGTETAIAGVLVTLVDGAGATVATATTDANGEYFFGGLEAGAYRVIFLDQADKDFVDPNKGEDTRDSDVVTGPAGDGSTGVINLAAGQNVKDVDAGAEKLLGSISGRYFCDDVRDDRDDEGTGPSSFGNVNGTETAIAGVLVTLVDGAGATVATATTDANGEYFFGGLEAGAYRVIFLDQADKDFVDPNKGEDTRDSDVVTGPAGDGSTGVINLAAGQNVKDVDAGAEKLLGSISGRYFCDDVRDDRDDEGTGPSSFGNVNGTETAIAGVLVTLVDGAGATVATATTDANGEYFFGGLEAGAYRVIFLDQADKDFVDPNKGEDTRDSDVVTGPAGDGSTGVINLAAGQNVKDVDAGAEKLLGSISGRYFCDDVRDDRDDEGTGPSSFGNVNGTETAIAGVLVTLVDGAGATVATATTDANGEYFFGGLEAGAYRVIFLDQADKDFVDPNKGEDTRDSDVVTGPAGDGSTGVINLAAGQNVKDVDAGAEKLLGSISGRYFCDDVRDDRDDEGTGPSSFGNVNGTETAIAGVLVTLVDGAGATVATATTDANGEYFFGGLEAGAYRVIFLDQADKDFVDPNKGEDTRDSDVVTGPAGDGSTGVINLAAGQNVKDVDAGAEKLLGSISGRYFCDDVRDDRDDEGTGPSSFGNVNGTETAIAGVLVTLVDGAGATVATATTDANGEYFFGGLEAGAYRVIFLDQADKDFVDPNKGEDTRDSDVVTGPAGDGSTGVINLAAGQNVKDVDAGAEKLLGSISGRYFCDDVRDDRDDEGTGPSSFGNVNGTETAIAGVLVTLVDGAGATVATATTDANGEYFFGGLEAGAYRVIFLDQADKDFVDPNKGEDTRDSDVVTGPAGDGSTGVINLAAGQNVKDVDAGAEKLLGSISGRYFCDDVRDDRDDEGTGPSSFGNVNGTETAIAGVLVTLVDGAGATVATATTDANGEYFFGGLEAGAYRVIFLDQADKDFVDPNKGEDTRDSDVVTGPAGDGSTGVINLAAGQNVKDVDAGAEKLLGSISGRYFCDDVRDDRDDEGTGPSSFGNVNGTETAIAGVLVTLVDGAGATVATATTDANGEYFFGGLEAGAYRVIFLDQADKDFVDPNKGEDTRDSDVVTGPAGDGSTGVINLAAGQNVKDVDAGAEKLLGSISGRYFCDDVRDDRDDEGTGPSSFGNVNGTETAIADVLVTLVDGAGATVATATTDANGEYFFGGLEAGAYRVIFPDQADKDFVDPNVGEDTRDSDVVTGPAGDGSTGVINLAAGQNVKDVDAGAEKINNPPEPTPDSAKGCADELIPVDLSDNISDPDGDGVTITAINGVPIADGETKEIDGVFVTLNGTTVSFNGETKYAFLNIGDEEVEEFTYTVTDDLGATATSTIGITFCGDANAFADFANSLPTGIVDLQTLDETFPNGTFTGDLPIDSALPVTPDHEAWTIKVSGSGDDRFDGMVFDEAYCIEAFVPALAGPGRGQTDIDFAPVEETVMRVLDDTFNFGPNKAAGLSNAQVSNAINWILNEDFNGDPSYAGMFTDGGLTQPDVTDVEVQAAIWGLTDSTVFIGSPNLGQQADAQKIFSLALAETDFDVTGAEKVGILLNPTSSGQAFVFAVDYEDYDCLC